MFKALIMQAMQTGRKIYGNHDKMAHAQKQKQPFHKSYQYTYQAATHILRIARYVI